MSSAQNAAQAHLQPDRSSIRRRQEILENIRKQKAKEEKPAPAQTSFAEEYAVVAQPGESSEGHEDAVEQHNLDVLEEELQQELMGMGPASVGEVDSNLDSKDLDAAMRAVEQSTGMSTGGEPKPAAHDPASLKAQSNATAGAPDQDSPGTNSHTAPKRVLADGEAATNEGLPFATHGRSVSLAATHPPLTRSAHEGPDNHCAASPPTKKRHQKSNSTMEWNIKTQPSVRFKDSIPVHRRPGSYAELQGRLIGDSEPPVPYTKRFPSGRMPSATHSTAHSRDGNTQRDSPPDLEASKALQGVRRQSSRTSVVSGPALLHAQDRATSGELSAEEASQAAGMAAANEHGTGAKRGATHPGDGAGLLQNGHQARNLKNPASRSLHDRHHPVAIGTPTGGDTPFSSSAHLGPPAPSSQHPGSVYDEQPDVPSGADAGEDQRPLSKAASKAPTEAGGPSGPGTVVEEEDLEPQPGDQSGEGPSARGGAAPAPLEQPFRPQEVPGLQAAEQPPITPEHQPAGEPTTASPQPAPKPPPPPPPPPAPQPQKKKKKKKFGCCGGGGAESDDDPLPPPKRATPEREQPPAEKQPDPPTQHPAASPAAPPAAGAAAPAAPAPASPPGAPVPAVPPTGAATDAAMTSSSNEDVAAVMTAAAAAAAPTRDTKIATGDAQGSIAAKESPEAGVGKEGGEKLDWAPVSSGPLPIAGKDAKESRNPAASFGAVSVGGEMELSADRDTPVGQRGERSSAPSRHTSSRHRNNDSGTVGSIPSYTLADGSSIPPTVPGVSPRITVPGGHDPMKDSLRALDNIMGSRSNPSLQRPTPILSAPATSAAAPAPGSAPHGNAGASHAPNCTNFDTGPEGPTVTGVAPSQQQHHEQHPSHPRVPPRMLPDANLLAEMPLDMMLQQLQDVLLVPPSTGVSDAAIAATSFNAGAIHPPADAGSRMGRSSSARRPHSPGGLGVVAEGEAPGSQGKPQAASGRFGGSTSSGKGSTRKGPPPMGSGRYFGGFGEPPPLPGRKRHYPTVPSFMRNSCPSPGPNWRQGSHSRSIDNLSQLRSSVSKSMSISPRSAARWGGAASPRVGSVMPVVEAGSPERAPQESPHNRNSMIGSFSTPRPLSSLPPGTAGSKQRAAAQAAGNSLTSLGSSTYLPMAPTSVGKSLSARKSSPSPRAGGAPVVGRGVGVNGPKAPKTKSSPSPPPKDRQAPVRASAHAPFPAPLTASPAAAAATAPKQPLTSHAVSLSPATPTPPTSALRPEDAGAAAVVRLSGKSAASGPSAPITTHFSLADPGFAPPDRSNDEQHPAQLAQSTIQLSSLIASPASQDREPQQVNIGSPVQDDADRSFPPEGAPDALKDLRARVEAVQHERALEAYLKATDAGGETGRDGDGKENAEGGQTAPATAAAVRAAEPSELHSSQPAGPATAAAPAGGRHTSKDAPEKGRRLEKTAASTPSGAPAELHREASEGVPTSPRSDGRGADIHGAGQKLSGAGELQRNNAPAPAAAAAAPRTAGHQIAQGEVTSGTEPQGRLKQQQQQQQQQDQGRPRQQQQQQQQQDEARQSLQSTPQASVTRGARMEGQKSMGHTPQAPPATPGSSLTSRVQMLKAALQPLVQRGPSDWSNTALTNWEKVLADVECILAQEDGELTSEVASAVARAVAGGDVGAGVRKEPGLVARAAGEGYSQGKRTGSGSVGARGEGYSLARRTGGGSVRGSASAMSGEGSSPERRGLAAEWGRGLRRSSASSVRASGGVVDRLAAHRQEVIRDRAVGVLELLARTKETAARAAAAQEVSVSTGEEAGGAAGETERATAEREQQQHTQGDGGQLIGGHVPAARRGEGGHAHTMSSEEGREAARTHSEQQGGGENGDMHTRSRWPPAVGRNAGETEIPAGDDAAAATAAETAAAEAAAAASPIPLARAPAPNYPFEGETMEHGSSGGGSAAQDSGRGGEEAVVESSSGGSEAGNSDSNDARGAAMGSGLDGAQAMVEGSSDRGEATGGDGERGGGGPRMGAKGNGSEGVKETMANVSSDENEAHEDSHRQRQVGGKEHDISAPQGLVQGGAGQGQNGGDAPLLPPQAAHLDAGGGALPPVATTGHTPAPPHAPAMPPTPFRNTSFNSSGATVVRMGSLEGGSGSTGALRMGRASNADGLMGEAAPAAKAGGVDILGRSTDEPRALKPQQQQPAQPEGGNIAAEAVGPSAEAAAAPAAAVATTTPSPPARTLSSSDRARSAGKSQIPTPPSSTSTSSPPVHSTFSISPASVGPPSPSLSLALSPTATPPPPKQDLTPPFPPQQQEQQQQQEPPQQQQQPHRRQASPGSGPPGAPKQDRTNPAHPQQQQWQQQRKQASPRPATRGAPPAVSSKAPARSRSLRTITTPTDQQPQQQQQQQRQRQPQHQAPLTPTSPSWQPAPAWPGTPSETVTARSLHTSQTRLPKPEQPKQAGTVSAAPVSPTAPAPATVGATIEVPAALAAQQVLQRQQLQTSARPADNGAASQQHLHTSTQAASTGAAPQQLREPAAAPAAVPAADQHGSFSGSIPGFDGLLNTWASTGGGEIEEEVGFGIY